VVHGTLLLLALQLDCPPPPLLAIGLLENAAELRGPEVARARHLQPEAHLGNILEGAAWQQGDKVRERKDVYCGATWRTGGIDTSKI